MSEANLSKDQRTVAELRTILGNVRSDLAAEHRISLALQAEIDRLASENALLNETVRTYTTMLLESRSERDIAVTDLQASRQAYRELEAALDEHTVTLYGIFGDKRSLRALVDDAMKERPEIVTRVGGGA